MTGPALLPAPAAHAPGGAPVPVGTGDTIGVRGPAELLAAVLPGTTALAQRVRGLTVHEAHHGPAVEISLTGAGAAPLPVGVSPTGEPVEEGYTLRTVDGGAHLCAATPTGVFRGLTTVVQLAQVRTGGPWLPGGQVRDAPLLAWRGLSLDVARDFRTVAEIETLIDLLALYKLNVLHLHLTDNQAWRLASAAYPHLTDATDGRALSQADLRHLAEYAAARCCTLVPELDLPGHTAAALAAYPELAGDTRFPHPLLTYLDPGVPAALDFARTVLTEVADLVPGPFLHVGGDEAFGMPPERYAAFLTETIEHVHGLGRRVVAWQEATRSGALTARDVAQLWISPKDAFDAEAVKASTPPEHHALVDLAAETFALAPGDLGRAVATGTPVLLSSSSPLYLDRRYADDGADPAQQPRRDRVGFPGYQPEPVHRLAGWHPLRHAAEHLPGAQVAGGEAAIWAETIEDLDDLAFLLLPRLALAAERFWSAPESDWAATYRRLGEHEQLWAALGLHEHFRAAPPPPTEALS